MAMQMKCQKCGHKNSQDDDDEELKEGLKRSMEFPAKPKAKNGSDVDGEELKLAVETGGMVTPETRRLLENALPDETLKGLIQNQVRAGYLSNAQMQKLATREGFPKPISFKYILPGLVHYEYMNQGNGATCLIQKPAFDKMLADPEKSLVGKPVVNEAHRAVSPDDYKNGKADGIVTRAWYDGTDGWYHCEALIWDEETRQNILNGYSVSCEYSALQPMGPAGTYNALPYDKEILDGTYKHLAVVGNARYERAGAELRNSTGGKTMKLLQWLKRGNEEVKNSVDVDPDSTVIVGEDGKEYLLKNAISAIKEQEAAKAAKAKAEADEMALKNAKVLSDLETITIDGKSYTGLDLKNAMVAKAKNDADDKEEKEHKDGDHDDKKADNCKMCNAESDEKEEKEKKEKDAANALLMNSQHRLGQHIQPNEKCAICDGIASDRLSNAAKMREGKLPTPVVPSMSDGLKRGKEMMGKTRAQQEAAAAAK